MNALMPAAGTAVMRVSNRVEILCGAAPPPVPPELEPVIAAAWTAAQRRAGGRLFNGRVFSVEDAEPDCVRGHIVEYRLAVAALADPVVAAALDLRPMAVCGVLRTPEGIVFGRRSPSATHAPGAWQMPPAGSIDDGAVRAGRVDARGVLQRRLTEELGLAWTRIRRCRPLGLVAHAGSGVHELGYTLETAADFAEIERGWRRSGSTEYTALRVVAEADLPGFLSEAVAELVPAAPLLLRLLGLGR